MRRESLPGRAGFTLVELILVVTILGILTSVVAGNYIGAAQRTKIKATESQIKTFETALSTFDVHMGRLPNRDEGLAALVANPDGSDGWVGPYLASRQVPQDQWGRDYVYDPEGTRGVGYDLYSWGPDGQEGTGDDIGNWSRLAQR